MYNSSGLKHRHIIEFLGTYIHNSSAGWNMLVKPVCDFNLAEFLGGSGHYEDDMLERTVKMARTYALYLYCCQVHPCKRSSPLGSDTTEHASSPWEDPSCRFRSFPPSVI